MQTIVMAFKNNIKKLSKFIWSPSRPAIVAFLFILCMFCLFVYLPYLLCLTDYFERDFLSKHLCAEQKEFTNLPVPEQISILLEGFLLNSYIEQKADRSEERKEDDPEVNPRKDKNRNDTPKPPEKKDAMSTIIGHTTNILTSTGTLITYFSLIVILVTLVLMFMGFKWIREYIELRNAVEQSNKTSLKNLLTITHSLPLLRYTLIIPLEYKSVLSLVHDSLKDKIMREQAEKDSIFGKLLIINTMNEWIKGNHAGATKMLEKMFQEAEKYGDDEEVFNEIRFRLAVAYNQLVLRPKSSDMFSGNLIFYAAFRIFCQM